MPESSKNAAKWTLRCDHFAICLSNVLSVLSCLTCLLELKNTENPTGYFSYLSDIMSYFITNKTCMARQLVVINQL